MLDEVDNEEEYVVDDVEKEEEERRERRSVELQELRLRMTRQREISMVDTRWEVFFGNYLLTNFFFRRYAVPPLGSRRWLLRAGETDLVSFLKWQACQLNGVEWFRWLQSLL